MQALDDENVVRAATSAASPNDTHSTRPHTASKRTRAASAGDVPQLPATKVMLVDDDPIFRTVTTQALQAMGYEVIAAGGGDEALALATRVVPDLVLLDVMMGDLDGFTVCRRLNQQWGRQEVPVMIVTGLDDGGSVEEALNAGAAGFVSKPVNMKILNHRILFQLRAVQDRRQLRESQARLRRAQRLAQLGYWEWQVAEDRIETSEEFINLLGMPATQDPMSLEAGLEHVHPEDRAPLERDIRAVAQGRPAAPMDIRVTHADGRTVILHQILEYRDDDGVVLGTAQDVTQQRKAEAAVRNLAFTDTLTGLRSRGYFLDRLELHIQQAQHRHQRFGLLYMDLDGFKDINDSLGHDRGDRLLHTIAERVQGELRERDLAARLGGDEFCVLLTEVDSDYVAASVADRLLSRINSTVQLGKQLINPRVSIGIAHYPDDGESAAMLLKAADSAMYAAKQAGKHRYAFYDPSMTTEAERRLQLEHDLRRSVDNGELVLHYQPQVGLDGQNLTGVEALVRWNHPTQGLIPPDQFIDVAERIGFIDTLGEWVLHTACLQMREWRRQGIDVVRMAVNISPLHINRPDFVDQVARALEETGCPADALELEVTETVFQNPQRCEAVFTALNQMGVKIAIDDFGTGYSSLASLKNIPLDYLKIDREFVRDMLRETNAATLLGTMVGLGHALGYEIIAEGVEELAQVQALHGMDCDQVQGYYFSRPIPAADIPALVAKLATPPANAEVHAV